MRSGRGNPPSHDEGGFMVDIKKLREDRKLSQTELGKIAGVTRQNISKIETGNAKPSIETAKKIGEVLGFNWWEYFE